MTFTSFFLDLLICPWNNESWKRSSGPSPVFESTEISDDLHIDGVGNE